MGYEIGPGFRVTIAFQDSYLGLLEHYPVHGKFTEINSNPLFISLYLTVSQ
jgi:hypothetical protein